MPTIAPGDRAIFIGLPRAGKTRLMRALAAELPSVVVYDAKHDPDEWTAWARRRHVPVSANWEDIKRFPRLVHLVDQRALEDRAGWRRPGAPGYAWTEALRATFERGGTTVIYDEALQLLTVQAPHPDARRMITQGRSLEVGVWVGAQAPNWIDKLALRLAEHMVAFVTPAEDYRRIIAAERGVDSEVLAQLGPYQWAYHYSGAPDWVVYDPVPLESTE